MSAFETLNREHKHILRMLKIIDHTAVHLETGRPVPVEILDDELNFIKVFTDECHHGKEESVLFPMIEAKHNTDYTEVVSGFFKDHAYGRNLIRHAKSKINKAVKGDVSASNAIAKDLKTYTSLTRSHIDREEVFYNEIAPQFNEKELEHFDHECVKVEKKMDEDEDFFEMLDRLEGSDILREQAG